MPLPDAALHKQCMCDMRRLLPLLPDTAYTPLVAASCAATCCRSMPLPDAALHKQHMCDMCLLLRKEDIPFFDLAHVCAANGCRWNLFCKNSPCTQRIGPPHTRNKSRTHPESSVVSTSRCNSYRLCSSGVGCVLCQQLGPWAEMATGKLVLLANHTHNNSSSSNRNGLIDWLFILFLLLELYILLMH